MISPKVFAAGAAGLMAIVFWTIAIATFWKGSFTSETLTVLTTVSTTAVASLLAFLTPDKKYVDGKALLAHGAEKRLTEVAEKESEIEVKEKEIEKGIH